MLTAIFFEGGIDNGKIAKGFIADFVAIPTVVSRALYHSAALPTDSEAAIALLVKFNVVFRVDIPTAQVLVIIGVSIKNFQWIASSWATGSHNTVHGLCGEAVEPLFREWCEGVLCEPD